MADISTGTGLVNSTIENAVSQTIQQEVRQDPILQGGVSFVRYIVQAGQYISPWWSAQRDVDLRKFWKKPDYLSGAVYTMQARMSAIPNRVVARDQSNRQSVKEAEQMTELIHSASEFGEGWGAFFSKWVEDLVTQDNGAFAEVIGMGRKDGPLLGRPISIAHLDSGRCTRTGNAEFPVLYTDRDGKIYKLHYTRVLFTSQMNSPIKEMNGVGLCAVSRCINVAQTLFDILVFKQEKMGSRPHRAILIPKGGLDPEDVRFAFQVADNQMDSHGYSRYSKIVVAGSSSLPEASLEQIELSSLPDGFDEQTSITLGMATIALAFGVDARELFPGLSSGATRAEALLQHLKQRGKGPGQIIQTVETLFNHKILPAHLRFEFDFQDDAEDRQVADIKKVRSDRRRQDIETGSISSRISRELMVETGDLTKRQFEMLELSDGRLVDGSSVLLLFYSKDKTIKKLLDLGVSTEDALDKEANDKKAMLQAIQEKLAEAAQYMMETDDSAEKLSAYQAQNALIYLDMYYRNEKVTLADALSGKMMDIIAMEQAQQAMQQTLKKPPSQAVRRENRTRNVELTSTNQEADAGTPEGSAGDNEGAEESEE
jgi:hypothetical protein